MADWIEVSDRLATPADGTHCVLARGDQICGWLYSIDPDAGMSEDAPLVYDFTHWLAVTAPRR